MATNNKWSNPNETVLGTVSFPKAEMAMAYYEACKKAF